ncbi:hypothetical protein [Chryseobacterium sp. G0201]|uniref:hypothetical protein n=1 Tax=Chryseobacterium sp. G0201 TaxID=2487065 RepID=UPI000F4DB23C|nr:hypothetical protein [Chryseobacterium sp. G0201]AZA53983.1 hypothetical protein EG348_13730 [Chryseobacterium sp. G0201]
MCYNFNSKGVNLKKAMTDFNAEEIGTPNFIIGQINAFSKQTEPTIPAIVNHNGIVLMPTYWGTKEIKKHPTSGLNLKSEKAYFVFENNTLKYYLQQKSHHQIHIQRICHHN